MAKNKIYINLVSFKPAYTMADLQTYLEWLYDTYDQFQTEYKAMHNHSATHHYEPMTDYYLRWRDKMRTEIRRVELLLVQLLNPPRSASVTTKLRADKIELPVENFRLHNVVNSEIFAFHY